MNAPVHGGPGPHGRARHDFSTNANAAGPCPAARAAVRAADATAYPDASYRALHAALAGFHGVAPARVLLAASASEFVQRFTAVSQRLAPGPVLVPVHAYDDYARAAAAHGRVCLRRGDLPPERAPTLRWAADPGSPLGQDDPPEAVWGASGGTSGMSELSGKGETSVEGELSGNGEMSVDGETPGVATVLDAVYAPLRLSGSSAWDAAARDHAFVLHSPNKALGLCGVRGAYAIAPASACWQPWLLALQAAAPSWPLGAHGVALLQAWCSAPVQAWLSASLPRLRRWKAAQGAALQALGHEVAASHTPFFCVRPRGVWPLATFAQQGVQLRDATSFGLPGWWRVNTLAPAAQAALLRALEASPP